MSNLLVFIYNFWFNNEELVTKPDQNQTPTRTIWEQFLFSRSIDCFLAPSSLVASVLYRPFPPTFFVLLASLFQKFFLSSFKVALRWPSQSEARCFFVRRKEYRTTLLFSLSKLVREIWFRNSREKSKCHSVPFYLEKPCRIFVPLTLLIFGHYDLPRFVRPIRYIDGNRTAPMDIRRKLKSMFNVMSHQSSVSRRNYNKM